MHLFAAAEYHGMSGETLGFIFFGGILMCNGNGTCGGNYLWIIILLILFCGCGCGNQLSCGC